MKLEYLATGWSDCPLIRLCDFTRIEAGQFHAVLTDLATGTTERVEVQLLPFVEVVEQCRLALIRRGWDQAVIRTNRFAEFECGFTAETWENVADLVEPFAQGAGGFQWLATTPGEAALLLSASGEW
jgi:hypothetical protein